MAYMMKNNKPKKSPQDNNPFDAFGQGYPQPQHDDYAPFGMNHNPFGIAPPAPKPPKRKLLPTSTIGAFGTVIAGGFIAFGLLNTPLNITRAPTATAEITASPEPTIIVENIIPTHLPYEELTQNLERSMVWIKSLPRNRFSPVHGTGVILSEDGLILTNAHVISFGDIEAGSLEVYLTIGTRLVERSVTIVGIAPCEDLALLDMSGGGYLPIVMNTSTNLGLGAEVFLMGYGQSTLVENVSLGFTRGEISRPLVNFSPYQALIEHTADLLPSDSGSPLFNRYGQMIGINTLMDVEGRGRRASYAIRQERIQLALAYLMQSQPPSPSTDYVYVEDEAQRPVYQLNDYFDRNCYTVPLTAEKTLTLRAYPQDSNRFFPILSLYDSQNQLLIPPTELAEASAYTYQLAPIPADGLYTVLVSRRPTNTGGDKLGDYKLVIREE